jgi:transcriptional regulator with XRE-family HTH domain
MDHLPGDDCPAQIKRLRARLGLTQAALAERLGVSFPTINRWERGKSRPSQLSWSQILKLAGVEEAARVCEPEPPPYTAKPPVLDFTAGHDVVRVLVEGERLSFGHLANPAFATEIASIDPLPHQRIAVYDHMLRQARLRFLLADDAGAGKTIMTGLYIREMLSRRLLKRILIVPPAGLIGNWQRELSVLFSLQFEIVSGSDARTGNPFTGPSSNRLIVSMDTLAGKRMFARLQEEDVKPYEVVVFDEAHKLSCDRGADFRVRKTDRYCLAEAIAGVHTGDQAWRLSWHAQHLLLLTATPHMGKDYPYYALWRLLEPEVLATIEAFDQFPPGHRKQHFIRRTKEEMVKLTGEPLYPRRIADTLAYDLAQGDLSAASGAAQAGVSEQRLYDETTKYLQHVYNRAKLLNQSAARLAMGVFQRRLASSTYALLRSFERRIEKLSAVIDDVQAGRITMEQLQTLQRRISEDDDVLESKTADDESTENGQEENEVAEGKLLQGVIAASLADLLAEQKQVEQLRGLAQRVHDLGQESKFDKLQAVITDHKFAGEKLIVFTEHRDTLDFLVRRLGGLGYTGQIAMIHGGMHYTERQEQVERFRKRSGEGGARFMVCTDAAAEGINLQFCWIMINYDVPWNPARLEQRMGRIHRYGQKHDPVIILNLVAPSTREGRVLKTLLDKLEKIRKQLKSDKVYDSIGRIFTDVSIKAYMELAVLGDPAAIAKELDGRLTKEQVQALAERERRLFGNGGDVQKELPRLQKSIEQETFFRLLPGYVRRFISSAAPLVNIQVDGDLGGVFALRPTKKGAVDRLLPALEVYPAHQRKNLSVLRPEDLSACGPAQAGRETCVWMHPGEPVFERFREIVRGRLGQDALRGSVFVDPTAQKPYLFHLARLTVVRKPDSEIEELGQEETVECRLVGVRQAEGAEVSLCPVEHLLLLRGGHGLPPEAQRLAVVAKQHRDLAQAFLTERLARTMAVESRSRLLNTLGERETFVKRGFDFQEAELAAARAKLSQKARDLPAPQSAAARQAGGNKAAAQHLSEIRKQQRALSQRRDRALAILRREPELIVPGAVEFIAHALVVPSTDQADIERHQAHVEQIAMDLVRAFEEAAGAKVRFVHTPELARAAGLPDHPGFDVLSMRPSNLSAVPACLRRQGTAQAGDRRCIEVKGRAGTGEIEVTDNEWARACNLRGDYWLYAVYHCATPTPQMVRVQDPFEKLLVRPFTKTQIVETVRELGGVRIAQAQVLAAGEL